MAVGMVGVDYSPQTGVSLVRRAYSAEPPRDSEEPRSGGQGDSEPSEASQTMVRNRHIRKVLRIALAAGNAAGGVTALYAQQLQAPTTAVEPLEEVIVTGTRLATPNEISISPITSV